MQLTSPVWVDSEMMTFRFLGLPYKKFFLLDPRTALNAARASLRGFRNGKVRGDIYQQGGVLVLKQGGEPVYSFASQAPGDMPPTPLVLQNARDARR